MKLPETERLLKVVHDLRTKCPWDKKQTHKTLVPYLIEEAYEAVDAIEGNKKRELCEELGDVLLQVALHAEIAGEKKHFKFEDVAREIADKMIRRHPHIYAKAEVKDYKTHMKNWQKLKSAEKPKQKSLLSGVPKVLPALQLSQRYGEIAGSVGFDWDEARDVMGKVHEEVGELEKELKRKKRDQKKLEMEFGDLLFSLGQIARHLKVDAEASLRKSTEKFAKRFQAMEALEMKEGRRLHDCSKDELEKLWNKVKKTT